MLRLSYLPIAAAVTAAGLASGCGKTKSSADVVGDAGNAPTAQAGAGNGSGTGARPDPGVVPTAPDIVPWSCEGAIPTPIGDLERLPVCEPESPRLLVLAGALGGVGHLDGRGEEARLAGPFGMASDGAGSLFVFDNGGFALRRIRTETGDVTTLREEVPVYSEQVLVSDGRGNLYVHGTEVLYEFSLETGRSTLVAGVPGQGGQQDGVGDDALLTRPTGMTADGEGNLYIASSTTIRRVNLATRAVETLVGSPDEPAARIDGDRNSARLELTKGITYDGEGNLYFVDGQTIRKLVIETGEVSTLVGPFSAGGRLLGPVGPNLRVAHPAGIASDCDGKLYVAYGTAIHKVQVDTGTVTMLAGSETEFGSVDGFGPDARFDAATEIATDGRFVYVTEYSPYNPTIRRIDVATTEVTTLAGARTQADQIDGRREDARFLAPVAAASNEHGDLYVLDTWGDHLRLIGAETGQVTTVLGSEPGRTDGVGEVAKLSSTTELEMDGGRLYLGDYLSVRAYSPETGELTTLAGSQSLEGYADGIGPNARFRNVTGLASDGNGRLYVGADELVRVLQLGTNEVSTLAGRANTWGDTNGVGEDARFSAIRAVEHDGDRTLYIAEPSTIRRMDTASRNVTLLAGSYGFVAESLDGVGDEARFADVVDMVMDRDGNLLVVDLEGLRKVVPATGEVTTLLDYGAGRGVRLCPAHLGTPSGLSLLPDGELIITEINEPSLLLLTLE